MSQKLNAIYFGGLTKDSDSAATIHKYILTINQDGIDKLHHIDSGGKAKRTASFNWIDVSDLNIIPEKLTNSSVRLGLTGIDAWQPNHFIVWGERTGNPALNPLEIIPLAFENDINISLKSDGINGKTSMPLRKLVRGTRNMEINRLYLVMLTHVTDDAETNSPVEIQISNRNGNLILSYQIPDTTQDDQEAGVFNTYFIPVTRPFKYNDLDANSLVLFIKGTDAWRPWAIYLWGLDDAAGRPEKMVPLAYFHDARVGILSADTTEGQPSVVLPLAPMPFEVPPIEGG